MPKSLDTIILEKARIYIANPATWTWGANARDRRGREVHPRDARAVRFCALGACRRAAADIAAPEKIYLDASSRLTRAARGKPVYVVNDTEGQAATIALFDRVLAQE